MSKDEKKKKPGFMKRFFSTKKMSLDDDPKENTSTRKLQRNNTVDPGSLSRDDELKVVDKPKAKDDTAVKKTDGHANGAAKDVGTRPKANGAAAQSNKPKPKKDTSGGKRRKKKKKDKQIKIDIGKELSFPCTPEIVLEYHKSKPFLSSSEEWLIVELNEFECLLDSMKIVKIIAKHSKFFEVEPDELWEEFFEWVDDCPAYDEVINYDIWQEFRDKKYPM